MNSIFGIYRYKKNKMDKDIQNLLIKYHNKISIFQDKQIILGKIFSDRDADLKITSFNDFFIVGKIKIYNKDDLIEKLGLDKYIYLTDEMLFIYSYLKWGKEFISYLRGHWTFALWDKRKNELFIARDDSIQTNLYYYWDNDFLIFSTNLRFILNLSFVKKELNTDAIYTYTGTPNDNKTLYKNIDELTSSLYINIGFNIPFQMKKYNSINKIKKIKKESDSEYVNSFFKIYETAIKNSIKDYKSIATTLSSGLDSGSITTLTSKLLEESQKKLYSYSFVSTYDVEETDKYRVSDETSGIQKILENLNNIESKILKNKDLSYIDAFNLNLDLLGQPLGSPNIDNCLNMVLEAKNDGRDLLLIGQNGNFTISYQGDYPFYLNTLIKDFDFVKYIYLLSKEKNCIKTVAKQMLNLRIIHQLRHQKHKKHMQSFSFFNQKYLSLKKEKSNHPSKEFFVRLNLFKHQKHLIRNKYKWNEWGEVLGIDIQDPSTDIELINYCLGIPESQYISGKEDKLLIRKAMKELMPKDVLWAKKRGLQSADLIEKAKQQKEQIGDTLSMILNSSLCKEYLNIKDLEKRYSYLEKDENIKDYYINCSLLLSTIHYGLFLLRLERNCI